MKTLIRTLIQWYKDMTSDESGPREFFAMLNGIIVIVILIFGFKFVSNVYDLKDRIELQESQQIILVEQLQRSNQIIESLKAEDAANNTVIQAFKDMYKRDQEKQEAWNNARSHVTNADVHLYVEEVVKKYEEFESEGK